MLSMRTICRQIFAVLGRMSCAGHVTSQNTGRTKSARYPKKVERYTREVREATGASREHAYSVLTFPLYPSHIPDIFAAGMVEGVEPTYHHKINDLHLKTPKNRLIETP